MKIKFCGADREVTGSSHLIELDDGYKILLDCGLYQGHRDAWNKNNKWFFNPAEIDCLILSHAHIDHTGRVPKLFKDGFRGEIHSTHATRSLCSILLLDSAKIQEYDVEYWNKKQRKRNKKGKKAELREPLYMSHDVLSTMEMFHTHAYNKWIKLHDGVEVLFRDAGHILGSASVTLRINTGEKQINIGFTGDIGRKERPILRDPVKMPHVDYLICESTYGDRVHDLPPAQMGKLLKVINDTCIERKGKVFIPAFSVGRTQEIVYKMDQLYNEGKLPKIPVFVDSPLAVNATNVYASHPECFDEDLITYLLTDSDPFGFNSLKYTNSVSESKQLNTLKGPAIIISASGMMNAGRIRHHLFNHIEDERNTILMVGYAAPHTTGGMIAAGATEIKLFGEIKQVNAHVERMESFSAHGDKNEMYEFIKHQHDLKRLFLVHGEYDAQKAFKYFLVGKGIEDIDIPNVGDVFYI